MCEVVEHGSDQYTLETRTPDPKIDASLACIPRVRRALLQLSHTRLLASLSTRQRALANRWPKSSAANFRSVLSVCIADRSGALDAADAAIACARAHGAMLRIHMGCAAHEDAAEALEVVGQLARLVDASLARAPLDVETSDEEDATRLRVGAVVSTKWGPAVVEARRPAADAAQPRRVACRTFWRARVICEKADVLSAPCAVKSPFGVVDLQDRVVKRADGTLLCSIKLPDARGEMLLPPCSINYVPPVTTRVWRRRH